MGLPTWSAQITRSGAVPNDEANDQAVVYIGGSRSPWGCDLSSQGRRQTGGQASSFAVRRAGIEGFARDLEARGRARATVTRRLSTIAGFNRYAVEEGLLDHSPAARVRRPRVIFVRDHDV